MGHIEAGAIRATVLVTAAIALFAGGCAQEPLNGPSYVGLSTLTLGSEAEASTTDLAMDPAVRHINSNKVLGAMAFQKVTGRSVDPGRLVGSD